MSNVDYLKKIDSIYKLILQLEKNFIDIDSIFLNFFSIIIDKYIKCFAKDSKNNKEKRKVKEVFKSLCQFFFISVN